MHSYNEKLGAYIIDGQIIGIERKSYLVADLNGNKPYITADVLPEGYADITSIEGWHTYGMHTGKDYRFVRDRIKYLVKELGNGDEVVGFNALSFPDKLIACEHKLGTQDQRIGVVGIDNTVMLGLQYHSRVSGDRQVRAGYAITELYTRIPDQAEEVLNDIMTMGGNLFITYMFFGREGTLEGDEHAGIMDYMYGRTGTIFEGIGLLQKPWQPIDMTMQQLVDKLYEIVIKGNY
jgi:hypothetical protein